MQFINFINFKFRKDFLQILIEHEQEEKENVNHIKENKPQKQLTNGQIISQSLLFMLAGTDSTAAVLYWVSYKLALHPEIQDKLINEVDSILEKYVILINFNKFI